jgi:hypothetical protein
MLEKQAGFGSRVFVFPSFSQRFNLATTVFDWGYLKLEATEAAA